MPHFMDLFSPETHKAFSRSAQDISGFRVRLDSFLNNGKAEVIEV